MATQTEKAKAIFLEAVEQIAPEQWPVFLQGACRGDAELHAQVDELLKAHADMGSFHAVPGDGLDVTTDFGSSVSQEPGTMVGPYKLLQPIGEGGFGVVYMAEQTGAGAPPGGSEDHQARDGYQGGDCQV